MDTTIQIFNNPDFGEVRVAEINGKPYFVGKDVATILGYENTNDAIIKHVDEEGRIIVQLSDIQEGRNSDPLLNINQLPPHMRGSKIGLITESGMYALVFGSQLEGAKAFKKWVTSEVLPAIRRTGTYALQNRLPKTFSEALRLLADTVEQNEKLQQKIIDDQPKVDFAEHVSDASNAISFRDFAKLLCNEKINIGQNRLFDWMRTNKYILKDNTPYQEYIDKGYFKVLEQTFQTAYGKQTSVKTLITGKGQIYFTEKLRRQHNSTAKQLITNH